MARVEDEEVTAAAKDLGYPLLFMAGIKMDPIAATSATADPEISAKNSDAPMVTMDRPPRTNPSKADANAIRRREDAGGVHDGAGENEQGNRNQRKIARAVVKEECDVGQRIDAGGQRDGQGRGNTQCNGDGHVDKDQRQQGEEHRQKDHPGGPALCPVSVPPLDGTRVRSSATMNNTAPMGMTDCVTLADTDGRLTR